MAQFIELTLGDGSRQIVNTNIIETISITQNGCAIRFTKDSSKGNNTTVAVVNKYDELKKLLQ